MKYTVHRIPTMKHSVYRTFTVKYRLQLTEYAQRNILSEKILTMKYTVYRIPAMKYSVYGILIMNNTYSLQNTKHEAHLSSSCFAHRTLHKSNRWTWSITEAKETNDDGTDRKLDLDHLGNSIMGTGITM